MFNMQVQNSTTTLARLEATDLQVLDNYCKYFKVSGCEGSLVLLMLNAVRGEINHSAFWSASALLPIQMSFAVSQLTRHVNHKTKLPNFFFFFFLAKNQPNAVSHCLGFQETLK